MNDPLKEGSTRVLGSRGSGLTRQILVVSEVALALVLMIGAALLIRSFAGLRATDPGFHADRVLTAKLVLPEARFRDATTLDMFNRRIVDEIAAVPGVRIGRHRVVVAARAGSRLAVHRQRAVRGGVQH